MTEISVVVVCVYACKPGYCVFKTLKDFESVKVLDIFEDYESVNAADTDAVCQTGLL